MIKIGDQLPDTTVYEFISEETPGCTLGPNAVKVQEATKSKKIIIFGLPGAFTPTCSAQHVPGYLKQYDALKNKGVDEVWCVSVNDAFVMGAWAQNQHTATKIRMLGDGSGALTKALGLELDLIAKGMGIRSQRYAMIVENGVVKKLEVEEGGKFEKSSAESILLLL